MVDNIEQEVKKEEGEVIEPAKPGRKRKQEADTTAVDAEEVQEVAALEPPAKVRKSFGKKRVTTSVFTPGCVPKGAVKNVKAPSPLKSSPNKSRVRPSLIRL